MRTPALARVCVWLCVWLYCEHVIVNRLQNTHINIIISKSQVRYLVVFGSCYFSGNSPCVASILIQFNRKKMKMKKTRKKNGRNRAELKRWSGGTLLEMSKGKSVKFHPFSMHVSSVLLMRCYFVHRTLHLIFRLPFLFRLLPFLPTVFGFRVSFRSSRFLFRFLFILTFNALRSYITRNIMRVKKDFRLKKKKKYFNKSVVEHPGSCRAENTFAFALGPGSIRLTLGKLISKSATQNGIQAWSIYHVQAHPYSIHNMHIHRA